MPLTWRSDDGTFTVTAGDVDLVRYTYRGMEDLLESPRPYFHPLRTTAGETVTVHRPWDHVWHRGLSWSLPNFGNDNFWGGPTYRRGKGYVLLPNHGRMLHERVLSARISGSEFEFSHALGWWRQDGGRLVDEIRRIWIRVGSDNSFWTLGFESSMTNVSEETIEIGSPTTEGRENAGYGGLFWRGPRDFTSGRLVGPDGSTGETVRGMRGPWLAFIGQHDGSGRHSTVLMLDDDRNAQHSPEWFARSAPYACLGPAPFFSREVIFEPGGTMVNRYAVVIADGECSEVNLARLADIAKDRLRQA